MRNWGWLVVAVGAAMFPASASAQSVSSANANTIGYPTVAIALEALRERSDVDVRIHDGWTIITEQGEFVLWSFTPPSHPAHPAVVRRAVIKKNDGAVVIEMTALCQAEKAPCDRLMADFEELNEAQRASLSRKTDSAQNKWAPSEAQKSRALETAARVLTAIDSARYQDAYGMFTQGLKSIMSFDQFVSHEQTLRGESGDSLGRDNTRITWYNDPPNASAPGVFAAIDMTCHYSNEQVCEELLILHEQSDGRFLVMRHERTMSR